MSKQARRRKPATVPTHIWADYDAESPRDVRWSFYRTRADQRIENPHLKPIKLLIVGAERKDFR